MQIDWHDALCSDVSKRQEQWVIGASGLIGMIPASGGEVLCRQFAESKRSRRCDTCRFLLKLLEVSGSNAFGGNTVENGVEPTAACCKSKPAGVVTGYLFEFAPTVSTRMVRGYGRRQKDRLRYVELIHRAQCLGRCRCGVSPRVSNDMGMGIYDRYVVATRRILRVRRECG